MEATTGGINRNEEILLLSTYVLPIDDMKKCIYIWPNVLSVQ